MRVSYIILILLLVQSLTLGKTIDYEIDMWGIHVADVTIQTTDTLFNGIQAKNIQFSTETTPLTSKLFRVDNEYSTIVEKSSYKMLSFYKKTYQPGVENLISTELIDNKVCYKNSNFCFQDGDFNIFSFLDFLSNVNQDLDKDDFKIEREGLTYNAIIKKIDNGEESVHYQLQLQFSKVKQTPLFEHTDIFTWALFKENTTKNIWINTKNNEIECCVFKSGLIRLSAKQISNK